TLFSLSPLFAKISPNPANPNLLLRDPLPKLHVGRASRLWSCRFRLRALLQALGDRKGINRFGDFSAPLDEALIHISLDLSGRPHLSYNLDIPTRRVGTYDAQLKLNTDFASIRCPETTVYRGITSDSVGEKFEEKIIVIQDFGGGNEKVCRHCAFFTFGDT
ncbi:hypothetical protein S245_033233, partial [Arachis hypogaea]